MNNKLITMEKILSTINNNKLYISAIIAHDGLHNNR